ncbi:hypothetical protein INS49_000672 [Diaporthe citri]|uniref:uncharacterized protein n=1 Tax=Diaporthe citri TaxID=83186 RepID=UPI001C7FE13D|nr:uncharacterized protein INS49_000672 [Diaporthe citri]KAG6366495.1 hypothetical protein INS49_000672 [Diaporthe citri]
MSLCTECKSMSTRTFEGDETKLFRHGYDSFRKAVFESKCYICCRVWESLTEEQKEVASRPEFMGIEYHFRPRRAIDSDGDPTLTVASLTFKWDDDLFDCEDYDEPGGFDVGEGTFTALNPAKPYAEEIFSVKGFEKSVMRLNDADSQGSGDGPQQYETVYQVWADVLESYLRCALTNPDDKFVAISGVVKDFARAIDDEYLAGLWRRNFVNGLLWTARPESNYDAGLKQSCPQGVFVSLTPGDPSLWSGVMFVRKGPYATAILRFYISFPDTYPALPPLVTFSTDMFHPLITPLTTYMYTTDIQEGGTVSATDEERLPPGGFSLRHGFPDWFGRGSRGRPAPGQYPPETPRSSRALAAGGDSNSSTPNSKIAATPPSAGGGHAGNAGTGGSTGSKQSFMDVHKRDISTGEVLSYIRSTFDDQAVMDSIPLEAAGNPGAWHAWAAYRGHTTIPEGEPAVRKPGDWNWEGVWEERVQRNIQASLSEPVLYGDIRFLSMEEGAVETVKDNLYKTLGESARADPLAVPSVNP